MAALEFVDKRGLSKISKQSWLERVCETPAGKAHRGGSWTARGKRVPVVEIEIRGFINPNKN